MTQALDLQARLEADRLAIREREAALAQAEEARATLQEQLRRRAEDLAPCASALDDLARQSRPIAQPRSMRSRTQSRSGSTIDDRLDGGLPTDPRARDESGSAGSRVRREGAALQRHLVKLKDVGVRRRRRAEGAGRGA